MISVRTTQKFWSEISMQRQEENIYSNQELGTSLHETSGDNGITEVSYIKVCQEYNVTTLQNS